MQNLNQSYPPNSASVHHQFSCDISSNEKDFIQIQRNKFDPNTEKGSPWNTDTATIPPLRYLRSPAVFLNRQPCTISHHSHIFILSSLIFLKPTVIKMKKLPNLMCY